MINKIYTDISLEKCLQDASKDLNIDLNKINYKIVEQKRKFLKKIVTISVGTESVNADDTKKEAKSNPDGTVMVSLGKVIVKNPLKNGKPAVITKSPNLTIFVNGVEVNDFTEIYEENKIDVKFDEKKPSRQLDITISPDRMAAYVTIKYFPGIRYKLADSDAKNRIQLETCEEKRIYPPVYTVNEIKEQLMKKGVIYGIIELNLQKCTKNDNISNIIVSKSLLAVNGKDDKIVFKVPMNEKKLFSEDKTGKVDFKSIGFVQAVEAGTMLAERIEGTEGKDGIDIFGKKIHCKKGKKKYIKAGEGTEAKGNAIYSKIKGRPCLKGSCICVYKCYELPGNVDLKTGNINFAGDVIIRGSVLEGMKVESGNSICIDGNVENAEIYGKGNVEIKKNIISSKVTSGGEDILCSRQITNLNSMKNYLTLLLETMEQIKENNLLGIDRRDGEIVKVLIENKFTQIPNCFYNMLTCLSSERETKEKELLNLIKDKLIGNGPLSLKSSNELYPIIDLININVKMIKKVISLPVDVKVGYCQDSKLSSSGDVIFTGKGSYISNVTAAGNIYFESPESIIRGGVLEAGKEIKCSKVGSTGGVITKLKVEKEGHIWADSAYQNTVFIIGMKECSIDYPSKSIHAYLDDNGELCVDKLKL